MTFASFSGEAEFAVRSALVEPEPIAGVAVVKLHGHLYVPCGRCEMIDIFAFPLRKNRGKAKARSAPNEQSPAVPADFHMVDGHAASVPNVRSALPCLSINALIHYSMWQVGRSNPKYEKSIVHFRTHSGCSTCRHPIMTPLLH
jgi:hypothetical protein